MDVGSFCRQSRIAVIAGKGGVGKTIVAAALSRSAAEAGLRVLLVDLEGKPELATAFGKPGRLQYSETLLVEAGGGGSVTAKRITPDDALTEYLIDHGMKRIGKRLVSSGALDVVSTAIPGIRDILVLGRIKQLERSGVADLIVVDAPATGHTLTFLSSARGLLDAARSGPVQSQAAEVVELLADPGRCQVILVTLPSEMPVNEVVEAAYLLEEKVGVALGPVVVNQCLDAISALERDPREAAADAGIELSDEQASRLGTAAQLRIRQRDAQLEQIKRLDEQLPLRQLHLPLVFASSITPSELEILATALTESINALPDTGHAGAGKISS